MDLYGSEKSSSKKYIFTFKRLPRGMYVCALHAHVLSAPVVGMAL